MSYEPDADAVAAISAHMNDDHPDDTLLIARAYGADASIDDAEVTGVDGGGMTITATTAGGKVEVRVPWTDPLEGRPDVRLQVVKAYEWAAENQPVSTLEQAPDA